jgi:chromosome segregation ATPase
VNGLEISQQRINEQLAAVQTQQAGAVSGEAQLTGQIADLGTRLGALEVEIANHTTSLTALDKMQSTLETDNKQINSTLDRQIKLLKGMELLSRARLFLYQSNFGLAKQDIQSARAIFAAMQTSAPELESKDLAEVVNRLDLAIARLPEFPVVASDDLDIAWQLLLQGIPQIPTMTATFTVTPEPTVTLGATVTPASSATPTATATP